MLYVGTVLGVFVTFDGGKEWEPLNGGIPRNPVHDLVIHPRDGDIVVGTHGRSVWVLSAKPLQGLTDEIRKKDLHLFAVSDMRKESSWTFARRSPWDGSPETFPKIRGQIWTRTAGKGTARLKDSKGAVVKEASFESPRGFGNYEIELVVEPPKRGTVDPKKRDPKTVDEKLADPFEQERAKFIETGTYTLEVEIGGQKATLVWKLT
jgi:hypothetical protein